MSEEVVSTTSTKIKDYPIVELDINEIKEDKSNPNEMTLEQSRGLEKSIINFGRLKHIVVDQDNVIIDGFHRWEVEKANGTERVKVIQVQVKDEIEKKMMRETLNKLHGSYNKEKEAAELLDIYKNNRLDDLSELLAQEKEQLMFQIKVFHLDNELERQQHMENTSGGELGGTEAQGEGGGEYQHNKEINNPLSTSSMCPKCGYQW